MPFDLMPGELAVPALIGLLENETRRYGPRRHGYSKIFRTPGPSLPLIRHLKDPNGEVIGAAAEGLGCIADPRAADALINVLENRKLSRFERSDAASALGRLASHAQFDPLLAAYREAKESKDWMLQIRTLIALGATETRALGILRTAMEHERSTLGIAAVWGLGYLGGPEAVALLKPILKNGRSADPRTSTTKSRSNLQRKLPRPGRFRRRERH